MHRSHDVEGTILHDLDAKVRGQITYFFVNLSTLKSLHIATLNFYVHMSLDVEDTGQ